MHSRSTQDLAPTRGLLWLCRWVVGVAVGLPADLGECGDGVGVLLHREQRRTLPQQRLDVPLPTNNTQR